MSQFVYQYCEILLEACFRFEAYFKMTRFNCSYVTSSEVVKWFIWNFYSPIFCFFNGIFISFEANFTFYSMRITAQPFFYKLLRAVVSHCVKHIVNQHNRTHGCQNYIGSGILFYIPAKFISPIGHTAKKSYCRVLNINQHGIVSWVMFKACYEIEKFHKLLRVPITQTPVEQFVYR